MNFLLILKEVCPLFYKVVYKLLVYGKKYILFTF